MMNKKNLLSHEVEMEVPFFDLDPLQIVWHGNYLKYFDIARERLYDKLNIDLTNYFAKTNYVFPIIKTSTKHINSLRYRDKFICRATVVEARNKIVIDFEIRLISNNKICARGRSEQVAVNAANGEMLFNIPDDIRKALGF